MLEAKIASSLKRIIQNSYFKKKVNLAEQNDQLEYRFLSGRQIAIMIYEYFRVTGAHEAVLDYSDLFRDTSHGDDIQDFDTRRDEVLPSISQVPTDDNLESLYMRNIDTKLSKPNYQKLKTMVKSCVDQKIRRSEHEALWPETKELKQASW